jgi:predicted DNA-binding protein (MmcQ/YjbR family)
MKTAMNICAALPGATVSQPFDAETEVWKVGGKIFALIGKNAVSLKCKDAETAAFLIEIGHARRAPYLPRGGWVQFDHNTLAPDELAERLTTSHATIVSKLPKNARPA